MRLLSFEGEVETENHSFWIKSKFRPRVAVILLFGIALTAEENEGLKWAWSPQNTAHPQAAVLFGWNVKCFSGYETHWISKEIFCALGKQSPSHKRK